MNKMNKIDTITAKDRELLELAAKAAGMQFGLKVSRPTTT